MDFLIRLHRISFRIFVAATATAAAAAALPPRKRNIFHISLKSFLFRSYFVCFVHHSLFRFCIPRYAGCIWRPPSPGVVTRRAKPSHTTTASAVPNFLAFHPKCLKNILKSDSFCCCCCCFAFHIFPFSIFYERRCSSEFPLPLEYIYSFALSFVQRSVGPTDEKCASRVKFAVSRNVEPTPQLVLVPYASCHCLIHADVTQILHPVHVRP